MRKTYLYTAALCAALALGTAGCSSQASAQTTAQVETQEETTAPETEVVKAGEIESMEETAPQTLSPIRVSGPVIALGDDSLALDNQSGQSYSGEMNLNISEDTLILDGGSGLPVSVEDIQEGDVIYAYIGPAMTMSIPPMTNAQMILWNVPQDSKAPDYVEIQSVVTDGSATESVLTTTDGLEFSIPTDCQISPYLTRNIVTLDDLTQGRKCLIWSDDNNTASRIMVFAQ